MPTASPAIARERSAIATDGNGPHPKKCIVSRGHPATGGVRSGNFRWGGNRVNAGPDEKPEVLLPRRFSLEWRLVVDKTRGLNDRR